ncbi:uncharacterized protein DFL_000346 [Arthrobotrys flagrans]|uniref:Uncharacterized protein n=1 Tax=Arthrobotrys flagrans TaxID=97331 RepID=A0A437ADI0_ARTFL|nr:hypothetical protein DFL_000346 [Arthrobotrys flagrans]
MNKRQNESVDGKDFARYLKRAPRDKLASQELKNPRKPTIPFAIEAEPPSLVDSFDDEFSDDEDLIRNKIAYHKAERGKLLMQERSDPAILKVHLVALVEQYKVEDAKLDLHLAVLYSSDRLSEKVLQILKDFKFHPDLTPAENAMAYLVRAAAHCDLLDASEGPFKILRGSHPLAIYDYNRDYLIGFGYKICS